MEIETVIKRIRKQNSDGLGFKDIAEFKTHGIKNKWFSSLFADAKNVWMCNDSSLINEKLFFSGDAFILTTKEIIHIRHLEGFILIEKFKI